MYKSLSKNITSQINRQLLPNWKRKKGQRQKVPKKLKTAFENKNFVWGKLTGEVKGGYQINFNGFEAFCPYSEMYPKLVTEDVKKAHYDKVLEFGIVRLELYSAIVSRRIAVKTRTLQKAIQAWKGGKPLAGIINGIQSYGVFVDLGGIDGLVHVSELPDDLKVGIETRSIINQKIEVTVIKIDKKGKISLSARKPHKSKSNFKRQSS